jgi:hypothetical protein
VNYILVGRTTGEPLSYNGKVLVHPDKSELEFLFPNERVAPKPKWIDDGLTMALKDHPGMDTVQFPLRLHMNQFRD